MSIKIKQRDITDCGAACLASVAAHYKLGLPVSRIRQWAGTDRHGTSAWGLISAAGKMGITAKGVKTDDPGLTEIPLPAIAHLVVNERIQHFVVIYRVNSSYIEVMDPATGEIERRKREQFVREWSGVLILLSPSENFQPRNEKVSNLKRFAFLLYPHRHILLQSLVGAMVYTILGLSTSVYIQKITDHVLVGGNGNLLNLLSVLMLIILVVQVLIGVMQSVMVMKTGQLIDARLILGYYRHLLQLPQQFFDQMRTGEIVSRINDAIKIRSFINDTLINITVNLFVLFFAFLLMFVYNWKLALLMLLVVPLYVVVYWISNHLNKTRERKMMEQAAELESQLIESISSVKTIRQLGMEETAHYKTEMRFINLLHSTYKSGLNVLFSTHSTFVTGKLFTIILLWAGSYSVMKLEMTPGELMSFYALLGYFTGPASGLVGMNKTLQNASIAADRLFEIMDLEPEAGGNLDVTDGWNQGDIEFDKVSFSYGTRTEIFRHFNLIIKAGDITAIIGESGSGKTTIGSLLQKLYEVNEGTIRIAGINIVHMSNESLRKLVGIVPQDPVLFSGTIVSNIAGGDLQPDFQKIHLICRQLGMMSFIERIPGGLNGVIGEHGANLSGGQKQRLAIARTLYRDPEIIVFDEATSMLDPESEYYVTQNINRLKTEGKTVIVIAHRLSTVMLADQIVVLDSGRLAEEGNHQQLWEKKGLYYDMWKRQYPVFTADNPQVV